MRKYPQKYMKALTPVQHMEFLMKLPCVRCRGVAKRLEVLGNGFRVPACNGCDMVLPFPQSARLETLAKNLNLINGDIMTAVGAITAMKGKIFGNP